MHSVGLYIKTVGQLPTILGRLYLEVQISRQIKHQRSRSQFEFCAGCTVAPGSGVADVLARRVYSGGAPGLPVVPVLDAGCLRLPFVLERENAFIATF